MIIEFIKSFKRAYEEIHYDKLVAKGQIKDIKNLIEKYERIINCFDEIQDNLLEVWDYIPKKERINSIQKTYDLVTNGFYDIEITNAQISLKIIYKSIINQLAYTLRDMKIKYKKNKYSEVIDIYNKILSEIDERIKTQIKP